MSYPQNPETLVIKNEYYPSGLSEINVWNYYQKVKNQLLKETIGKSLIIFFSIDLNKFTVIRKQQSKGLIRLTPSNYNTIVSGRTISFHNVMGKYSNYGIIDIDTDNFNKAKDLVLELYDLFDKQKFVSDIKIIFTGKNSFHLRTYFNAEYKIEYIKQTLFDVLQGVKLQNPFTVRARRIKDIPNLDLQRNIYNAGHIALHSLSVDGLKVIEVKQKNIKFFRKEDTKI